MNPKPKLKRITQVGIVVKDSEATARRYWEDFGIGPWRFYTLDPSNTPKMMLRGRPVTHAFRAALATVGDVTFELIEPLDGESIYAEHLAVHGEGLHHLAFEVDDFADTKERLEENGYSELQSGRPFDVNAYAYFDTDRTLAFITELYSKDDEGKSFPAPQALLP